MSVKTLDQFPTAPMTLQETEIFANLLIGEMGGVELTPELMEMLEADFVGQVVAKRMEVFGGEATPHLRTLITFLAKGNPGRGLMLMSAVQKRTPAGEKNTVATFAEIFPMGFPTEDSYDQAWREQKVNGVAKVDIKEEWAQK